MQATPDKPAGLYVHIPFCLQKCRYCDFYSISDLSQTPRFMVALKQEMQMYRRTPLAFDTLYIGGGTPSVLTPEAIGELIETAWKYFNITSGAEVTMEINPGTVTFENLFDYRKMGVNRVNIGVQSFDDDNLRFLSRIHSARDARLSVEWARRAGFNNVGLDLIFGLPRQDNMNWLDDLTQAGNLEPEHLSCYMLTCESGTPLANVWNRSNTAASNRFQRRRGCGLRTMPPPKRKPNGRRRRRPFWGYRVSVFSRRCENTASQSIRREEGGGGARPPHESQADERDTAAIPHLWGEASRDRGSCSVIYSSAVVFSGSRVVRSSFTEKALPVQVMS